MSRSSAPKKGWLAYYSEVVCTWKQRAQNSQDAEDAMHDAVLSVLENETGVLKNPRAYLYRSVHNRLIDGHRRTRHLDLIPLHYLDERKCPSLNYSDAQIHAAELLESLKEALAELPIKCRQVFLWHRLEGYTQEEIARKLDISVNMVEKYMIRAVRHLRDRLRNYASS